jgi:cell division septum initiation protein DivIVA
MAMRGYDRKQVDEYVIRVNRVLAELQITAAPESAIRHALEQVSEETKELLQSAHEAAEAITRGSRGQADDRVQQATQEAQEFRGHSEQEAREAKEAAQREANEIREAAEAHVRDLEADAKAILEKRTSLIGELRQLLQHLDQFLDSAEARYTTSSAEPQSTEGEPS